MEAIFEIIGNLTGLALIKLFTKGDWVGIDPVTEPELTSQIRSQTKRWQLTVKIDNKTYYDTSLATLIGVLFWIFLIAISIGTAVLIKS